jgi:serine/threonine-protein kinase
MTDPHQTFEFLDRIGQGGSAWVFRVRNRKSGTLQALKQMRPDRPPDRIDRALFAQETSILKELAVPGVPRIHQIDLEEEFPWFTLDLIEGTTLQDTFESSRLSTLEKADLLAQASIVVGHIHHRGIIHHDLKPSNILIGSHWSPWIVDFGIGGFSDSLPPAITQEYLVGTLPYLSPERLQSSAGPHDPSADVYALGVILYSILTGKMPFEGDTDAEIFDRIRRGKPLRPEEIQPGAFPRSISDLTMNALAQLPQHRPTDARVFAARLLRCLVDHAAGQSTIAA